MDRVKFTWHSGTPFQKSREGHVFVPDFLSSKFIHFYDPQLQWIARSLACRSFRSFKRTSRPKVTRPSTRNSCAPFNCRKVTKCSITDTHDIFQRRGDRAVAPPMAALLSK